MTERLRKIGEARASSRSRSTGVIYRESVDVRSCHRETPERSLENQAKTVKSARVIRRGHLFLARGK